MPILHGLLPCSNPIPTNPRIPCDMMPASDWTFISKGCCVMMETSGSFMTRHGRTLWILSSVLLLLGAAASAIVNLAVSGTLSWALYPLLCIAFAWVVLTLLCLGGRHRVQYALGALCLLVFPFLMLLDAISPVHGWARAIGFPCAGISVLYIAGVYATVRHTRWNGWTRAAAIVAGAVPVSLVSQVAASRYLGEPVHWTVGLDAVICLAIAALLLFAGYRKKARKAQQA